MPIYLGNIEISKEYVDSYQLDNIYLGNGLVQGYDPFIRATGGTVTFDGDYKIHSFTTVGTSSFEILALGYQANNLIEYLVVAGGGAGSATRSGVGGGAGGLLSGSYSPVSVGVNSIIVGAGGIGTNVYNLPTSGSNSSALGFLAYGGGTGGNSLNFPGQYSVNGGSGAGGGNTLDATQGNNGGTLFVPGGGGAGNTGGNGTNSVPIFAGNGGNGKQSSITGASLYYAGGGAGGGLDGDANDRNPGTGGLGGGGNGGDPTGNAAAKSGKDATFYGGGGGGMGDNAGDPFVTDCTSGDGYQGVVILRYRYK